MNKATLTALEASIAHWERLSTGKRLPGENTDADSCALCSLFLLGKRASRCSGCPVSAATGQPVCQGSPYQAADLARARYGIESAQFKAAAREELAFLRSLLPAAPKKKAPGKNTGLTKRRA